MLLHAVGMLLALQAVQATVAGTVRNGETGEPLVGALVMLADLDRGTVTDSLGRYVLQQVPPGPQHVMVRRIGFAARTLHALVPSTGELEINLSLQPQPIRLRALEVRPVVAVRGVDGADSHAFPDRTSAHAAIRTHPLLAEPDALQALSGGEVVVQPESPSGVHVRGGAADHTAYVLDGVPVFNPYHVGGVFSAFNPDAIARVHLYATTPAPALPDALSGTVAAETRAAGPRFRAQGALSTLQVRITADGPVGLAGAGYLLSLRSGHPSLLAPRDDASYLRGETGDALATLELPLLGGRVRVLGYESENEIAAAATADADAAAPARNRFAWQSTSVGAGWTRAFARTTLRIQTWSAAAYASAHWGAGTPAVLSSRRRDEGALTVVEHRRGAATTSAGFRLERSRTSYRVESDSGRSFHAHTPVASVFLTHAATTGRAHLDAAVALTAADRHAHISPRAQLRWRASNRLALTGSFARTHQFAQSLRNNESIVGSIFPAELYLGAGAAGVPVARSDQWVLAAAHRPATGMRVGVQAYRRVLTGLLLVALTETEPFATGDVATGSGTVRGASLELAASGARYGALVTYGWQQVRLRHGDSSYVPGHAAAHVAEAGMTIFPTATFSLRVGAAAALGRRATAVSGGLKWEACNLRDGGCEFGGTPRSGEPGATRLPRYVRVDLGVHKHWHIRAVGRDAQLELFGTITNVFARRNLLTYAPDPASERAEIEMRQLAPLVVGIDWRF